MLWFSRCQLKSYIFKSYIFRFFVRLIRVCSFAPLYIYAANYYVARRDLWQSLRVHNGLVHDKPWVIMGDFNSALNIEDKSCGSSSVTSSMREFKECLEEIEVFDINRTGLHYTWSQKPKEGIGLLKKIDRVLGNASFVSAYPESVAIFKPYGISDHCPCVLKLFSAGKSKPKPFKFANFLVHKPGFLDIVKSKWDVHINGVHQFRVIKKLTLMKSSLRVLLFQQGNLHEKVANLRANLEGLQNDIDMDPLNDVLRSQEAAMQKDFQEALLDEERFLKQKSKVEWLRAGDANTAYFHSSLKCKNHFKRIDVISDPNGNIYEGDNVAAAFVSHYEQFLGCAGQISLQPSPDIFTNKLDSDSANHMTRPVTLEEVKSAMFSIGNDKAPGPDGYTAAFFKSSWQIVGSDVSNAVLDFFNTGNLLKQLNHTLVVLIPKVSSPTRITDYRPISCCNVIFKCISKVLADRLKGSLSKIVSINQSAFVPGRKISDNILLTQELMHNYHRHFGPPRCAFKVDIQKAYDTVDWGFLKNVLVGFGFNDIMVNWIMLCVSTASYSICVNGNIHGYFQGKRGLRQGGPLSPYLFTLVMEVLTCILNHATRIDSSFRFHNKCEKQRIVNLCFADDLFLFARGDMGSARCIMSSLTKFTRMSGLIPSAQKSTGFFCNVPNNVKREILSIMPFVEGSLPVKYLGVPLISSRLLYKDCNVLVERLENRIDNWKNRMLSFAGRLQLIISVLSALHVYWSSVFILPARVIKELESKMRNFLWAQSPSQRGRAKVSWSSVCVPKHEGGLGIRRIADVNKVLMVSHIWSILSNRNSLWVAWIHSYRLRGRSFWAHRVPTSCCWSWRKMSLLRPLIRQHVWSQIGNGNNTFAWFDLWSTIGPLCNFLTPRVITREGFSLNAKVADVYTEGSWLWPDAWRDTYPVLIQLDLMQRNLNNQDRLLWRDDDKLNEYSSSGVWNSVRAREQEVNWASIVWFSQCVPRHAFLMWLIVRRKLLTQDKILQWSYPRRKNMNMMCCLLCYENVDSHDHLFFECKLSSEIWCTVRSKVGMDTVEPRWTEIVDWLKHRSRSKSARNLLCKLIVAASMYVIWQERNNRLFKNHARPPDIISKAVIERVRYKLMGLRFKNTIRVRELLEKWEIHDADLLMENG
ncbi:putative RNA-directed DNA polymerase [Helianthus annuus]|nr:putative RNA-directed DNA polymerase [Helianthus annuus]